jgi:hypothetical protein
MPWYVFVTRAVVVVSVTFLSLSVREIAVRYVLIVLGARCWECNCAKNMDRMCGDMGKFTWRLLLVMNCIKVFQ